MSVSEKEIFAVIFGVKEFRHYLFNEEFEIISDHRALTYLLNLKDPTGKLARWAIYLSQFKFIFIYRKGVHHTNADCLSRPVLFTSVEELKIMIYYIIVTHISMRRLCILYYTENTKKAPLKKNIRRVGNLFKKYIYKDEILYIVRKGEKFIVPKISE